MQCSVVPCPAPGMEPCTFPSPAPTSAPVTFQLLDVVVTGLDCGPGAAHWLSSFLGAEVRLVQHQGAAPSPARRARAKYVR